jgi:DNA-binding transcriptional MerR regulator
MPRKMFDPGKLPDKLYFRVKEVSALAGVPPYVLRFWETEFSQIRPKRTETGQRLYRRRDVEQVLAIKHLLHEKKFTIEGARRHLKEAGSSPTARIDHKRLAEIETGLREILDLVR